MSAETNGWVEYKQLVLREIESLNEQIKEVRNSDFKEVRKELGEIRVDISALKVRASAWGAIAGLIAGVLLRFAFRL